MTLELGGQTGGTAGYVVAVFNSDAFNALESFDF